MRAFARRIVSRTLATERAKRWTVGILLTDNKRIRQINKQFLRHNYATDVIAFGYGGVGARRAVPLLGDVVVSTEMARKVSKKLGIPFKEELARYLVHGVLHLLGYDDHKKVDYMKMHHRQELILKKVL